MNIIADMKQKHNRCLHSKGQFEGWYESTLIGWLVGFYAPS